MQYAEPGGVGIPNLMDYYIYHYTFDLDVKGGWMDKGAQWFWSKRRFMMQYPPRLTQPPSRAQRSVLTFVQMMNEGIASVPEWRPAGRRF